MVFLLPPWSARAPIIGANRIIRVLAAELPRPSQKVLSVGARPPAQYCLKKTGKKPAITTVAKAELPQSYQAQASCSRRISALDPHALAQQP